MCCGHSWGGLQVRNLYSCIVCCDVHCHVQMETHLSHRPNGLVACTSFLHFWDSCSYMNFTQCLGEWTHISDNQDPFPDICNICWNRRRICWNMQLCNTFFRIWDRKVQTQIIGVLVAFFLYSNFAWKFMQKVCILCQCLVFRFISRFVKCICYLAKSFILP